MIKERILKRLTRFGLCFYLFSYCMAFTVCAEEYPVLTPDAGPGVTDEAAYEEDGDAEELDVNGVTEADALTEDTVYAEAATDVDALAEEGALGAAVLEPESEGEPYNSSSFSGLHNQIFAEVGWSETNDQIPYSVYLTQDVYVDNGTINTYISRVGDVTIDARGHAFRGTRNQVILDQENKRTNLQDMKAFYYLTIKNARFVDFDDGVFRDTWVDLGDKRNHLTLVNCTFEGNTGSSGTAVYSIQEDYVSLLNCSFVNNTASGSGGVVYLDYPGYFEAEGCTFRDNTAGSAGGAIAISNDSREVEIYECSFVNNTAGKGGAIYDITEDDYKVEGCSFISNVATESDGGGAIYRGVVTDDSGQYVYRSAFLNNTEPEIVLADMEDRTAIDNFLGGNWFGGTVDQAAKDIDSVRPSILVIGGGEGVYRWKLLNLDREPYSWNKSPLVFYVYAASDCYSNGTIVYNGAGDGILLDVPFNLVGENITITKNTTMIKREYSSYGSYYRGGLMGNVVPGTKTYSVKLLDPMGNVLLTRSYDRSMDSFDVSLNNITNGTVHRGSSGPAVVGDILTFSAYANIYCTAEDGTIMHYVDPETGELISSRTHSGPRLGNEIIHVFVKGNKIGDYITDSDGFFNVSTNDLGQLGYVNMYFSVDFTSKQGSEQVRVLEKGYTEVKAVSYEPNNVTVVLDSPTANITEGTIFLYCNSTDGGERKLFNRTELTGVDMATFKKTFNNLNASLSPGLYIFTAEYTCDSGMFKNSTETVSYGGKTSVIVGPAGFTAAELKPGSSKNSLEVRLAAVTPVYDGNLSVWCRPANGGERILMRSWNMSEESAQTNFWGYLNVSSLSDGDYIFTANYNNTSGESMNCTCEKQFTIPIQGMMKVDDALVSIKQGSSKQVKAGDEGFYLNVTAERTGEDGGWTFESSNSSVATVDKNGFVKPLAVGVTNITATYESSYTKGSATLLLTVIEGSGSGNGTVPDNGTTPGNGTIPGNGTTPGNGTVPGNGTTPGNGTQPVPGENGTSVVELKKLDTISLPELNVTMDIAYTDSVVYTGSKFKPAELKAGSDNTYTIGGFKLQFNSSLLQYADLKLKFKNTKHATAVTGKKASVTIQLKAKKGIPKDKKALIKAANKVLKKLVIEFTLEQVDISKASEHSYLANKKGVIKKVMLKVNGVDYTLKANKDCDIETAADGTAITVKGKGDYKNTLVIPLNK